MSKSITQSNRWLEILEQSKEFSAFLSLMRKQNIKSIEIDGIKVEFQPVKYFKRKPVTPDEIRVDRPAQLSEEEQKKQDEEVLFWSSGA